MRASIRLGRIAGVEVGVDYSWFAILALISWSLADGFLPGHFPGWNAGTYWATGIVAALMLFASVLVHELAHSLVARARGIQVHGITLFFLGGVSSLKAESRRPRDEFVISVVGPLTSLALALGFGTVLLAFNAGSGAATTELWFLVLMNVKSTPVSAVVWYLALINLLLAGFNLLPAFPMDGGRMLRSGIWAFTGSLSRATKVAARGGQTIGLLLMVLGVLGILQGLFLAGIWFALIGWFLFSAATSSRGETVVEDAVRGVPVRDVMEVNPATIGPETTISDAVYEHFVRRGTRSLLVCEGDKLLGIMSLTDVKGIPRDQWGGVKVREGMTSVPLKQVGPEDDLSEALALLGQHAIHQAPVVDGGRVVGLLSRAHIIRYLHSRRDTGFE